MLKESESNREKMIACFCGEAPRIARFPHCIVRSNFESVGLVLSLVDGVAGIFGEEPLENERGGPFLPPEDGVLHEAFSLWERPRNQQEVTRYAKQGGNSFKFTMLINAQTSKELLREMYEAVYDDLSDYCYYIDKISDWIERLGWAYIPLDIEHCTYAIFVARIGHESQIATLKERIQRQGGLAFSLARKDGQWVWDEPHHET